MGKNEGKSRRSVQVERLKALPVMRKFLRKLMQPRIIDSGFGMKLGHWRYRMARMVIVSGYSKLSFSA
jgi:hypothetical protein